jgi:hypothetical protein
MFVDIQQPPSQFVIGWHATIQFDSEIEKQAIVAHVVRAGPGHGG